MRYALVPVKDLSQAKERLSPLLSSDERHTLAAAMLDDVLSALEQASRLERIALVTRDALATSLAVGRGFEVIDEGSGQGLSDAVEVGVQVCRDRGASSLAVIPGDIPLLTPADIDSLMDHGTRHEVVIVPSWNSRGTNTVLLEPPDVLPLRFSSWSFFPHVKAAKQAGLTYKVLRLPRVALDVDTPEDLARLMPKAMGTRSYSVLEDMGLLAKIERR